MSLAGTKVFIVEDEVIVLMELEQMLGRFGCQVVDSAKSLGDGIRKASALQFDLAIIDLNLAGHSAERIVDEVARRNIPLIITSGYELAGSPEERARPSEHKLLPKPFTMEELQSAMSFALGGTRRFPGGAN